MPSDEELQAKINKYHKERKKAAKKSPWKDQKLKGGNNNENRSN